ncbi:MAG: DUF2334 domain-containing protein [Candidatus Kapabacteria bacterium]|nr:DUF2334 domain-containing protein [Candidatus Kapabacteria bacterium]
MSANLIASEIAVKKILVVYEGNANSKNYAMADARQLGNLLGHFNTNLTISSVNDYKPKDVEKFEFCFYIGFNRKNNVPDNFIRDIIKTDRPVVWLNSGIIDVSAKKEFADKFGFKVSKIDSLSVYDAVLCSNVKFTKGEESSHIIDIIDKKNVNVLATALSTAKKKEIPYIVKSKNLIYIADSPFGYANETDRYLLFADMLHDILNEEHEHSHSAIVRIEDVTAMHDPDKLRNIADFLSSRGIPFLVGVVPIYVDPSEGLRVTLSDKPAIVDALKYMEHNGGTIVMHGVTHQYKGVSTADYEFWDQQTNAPIKDETEDAIAKKIEIGIQEFLKNGLHPILWETPHYTASNKLYKTITKYFSTSIEQKLAIENSDYSQYFPYIINKDLFGQRILPENLGYVPNDPDDKSVALEGVQNIIKGAHSNLYVRDGFAAFFFHPFLDLNLLKEIVDNIQNMGYTFIEVKDFTNWVKTADRVIITGSQDYSVKMEDQYLLESYYEENGKLTFKGISSERINGVINKHIDLQPGQIYTAHPIEYRERELSLYEKSVNDVKKFVKKVISPKEEWDIPHVALIWNYYALGEYYNDQASFAAVFNSLNINVDTIFIGENYDLTKYNLLIVPYTSVDSLKLQDYDKIVGFVEKGGNLITDFTNNFLADEFGIKFTGKTLNISAIRDYFYPEEAIRWQFSRQVPKLNINPDDIVLCQDDNTDAPIAVGRNYFKGKLIYFSTLFDPYTQQGYSRYPYLMEYVRKYFKLKPILRRNNLEVYFDPGFRATFSVENLVKQWVNAGVRIIHAAGWHTYKKYTYDYKRLINLAHANGILVYAWIEPPQVSKIFYDNHPEWREKNYKGEDVRPSWRYPVALTDRNCLEAVKNEYLNLLNNFDWDGVNLAELYFEAGKGMNQPELFTPMHESAKKEFKNKYNIDLPSIFNPASAHYWQKNTIVRHEVIDYRIKKLTEVYKLLLNEFSKINKNKDGFQVIVTAMDSYGSPELKENIAVDMSEIIKLKNQFKFALNVEDPENLWSTDPQRYTEIGRKYDSLLTGNKDLLLDLNIMNFRKKEAFTAFPTLIQTGTESYLIVNSASLATPRVVIYSEASVNPQDMAMLPFALASGVNYTASKEGFQFDSPTSFYLSLPDKIKAVSLNGSIVSSSVGNSFLIPAGKNTVKFLNAQGDLFSTSQIEPKIISITGNLVSLQYDMRSISFNYSSDIRTLVCVNREPVTIEVDGKEFSFSALKGNNCYSVFIPSGNHQVKMVLSDVFSYSVNLTSLLSSTGIALFGTLAVLMLIVMYISIKIVKRRVAKSAVI